MLLIDKRRQTIVGRLLTQIRREFPQVPVFMNFSYLPETLIEYIASIDLDLRPELLYEFHRLGPSRSLIEFSKVGYSDILVINGDLVLSNEDFTRMSRVIDKPGQAFLVAHRRKAKEARSLVEVDSNGVITNIHESTPNSLEKWKKKDNQQVLSLSGIYKLPTHAIINYSPEIYEPLSPGLVNFLLKQTETRVFEWNLFRYSIDSLEALNSARTEIEKEL